MKESQTYSDEFAFSIVQAWYDSVMGTSAAVSWMREDGAPTDNSTGNNMSTRSFEGSWMRVFDGDSQQNWRSVD